MKRFAVIGIIVFALVVLGALGFIGWNIYTLTQANGAYGRGMMQAAMRERLGEYANPDSPSTNSNTRGMGMMQGRTMGIGMMNGRGYAGQADMMTNCPCMDGDTAPSQSAPSTNPVPTSVPTPAPTPSADKSSSSASASSSAVSSTSSSASSSKPANGFSGKAGNLNVTLTMNPQPAAFSSTTFDITIVDEKGDAVSDANVSLDLSMPSMFMPSNKPQAQSLGNGKYQASGRFTMRGGWRINVIIDRGGQKQTVYFDIGL
jgi:hypothetical protein